MRPVHRFRTPLMLCALAEQNGLWLSVCVQRRTSRDDLGNVGIQHKASLNYLVNNCMHLNGSAKSEHTWSKWKIKSSSQTFSKH